MSFDSSRFTFHPRKNFLGVVMQQGRVQLDSDWNEWQSEYNRRIQAGTVDTLGQAVYPATTPEAFKITASQNSSGVNQITIGAGRYYVDGLLAENHGPESQAAWDTALAELSGSPIDSTSAATTNFTQQPYLPNAALPTGNGPFLAYLDVWQRDITYLEDPHLIDPAVGVDTTGRLQTVWQVKLLDVSSISGVDCTTDVSAFDALYTPPAGQLTNGLVPSATSGPCCLAPNTGYTGLENQLYRVEIHNGGTVSPSPSGGYAYPLPTGTPTFKWSNENASIATTVSAIATVTVSGSSVSQLTVASLGRDQVLGFAINDWIEITDDAHELNGQPGETYQITNILAATMTITLNGTVSSAFPLTNGQTTPSLHTRIIKWNQGGQVSSTDSSGNLTPWINLSSAGSTGLIPVPPAGTTLVLENGITVAFGLNPSTGSFNTGDYWNFAARTADGTIQNLTSAPPAGIHHHYAKLSIVTFPTTATDCRIEWPPSSSGCCECTVSVTTGDITGNTTLQSIFDQYQNQSTGTTICLAPGTYSLPSPLRLTSAHTNITLEACQPGTVTIQAQSGNEPNFADGLIVLDNVDGITLTGLNFAIPAVTFSATTFAGLPIDSLAPDVAYVLDNLIVWIGVHLVGGTDVSIENCAFALSEPSSIEKQGSQEFSSANENSFTFAVGVFATGDNEGFNLQGNEFSGLTDFSAGLLLAPSVSFASPPTIQSVPAAPTGVSATVEEKTASTAKAKTASIQTKQALLARPAAAFSGTQSTLSSGTTSVSVSSGALSGVLQTIFGASSVSNLASNGGTVLPATLDEAVIQNNTFVRMSVAAFILGELGDVNFVANRVRSCVSGIWITTLTQEQYLLAGASTATVIGASIAMGYPLPANDSSGSYLVTVPAAPTAVRIFTGASPNPYTDSNGNSWVPDVDSGVTISPAPSPSTDWTYTVTASINDTSDPTLYQSERAGPTFSYTFSGLPAGFYTVTLKFAEIYFSQAGQRVFNASINGVQVITNLDIIADIGSPDTADDKIFPNVAADNGQIVIQLTGVVNDAKIDAAEIVPQWSGTPYLGSNETAVQNFFDQLSQLGQQGYVNPYFSNAQLRIDNNEMNYLEDIALLIIDDDSVYNQDSSSLIMIGNRLDNLDEGFRFIVNETYTNQTLAAQAVKATAQKQAQPAIKAKLVNTQGTSFNQSQTQLGGSAVTANAYVSAIGDGAGFLVGILQVSRCVITGNMLTSGIPGEGYSPSLTLDDLLVQQAEIAVMSNVFTGRVLIEPPRNLLNTNLPAWALSWDFMNTIIE